LPASDDSVEPRVDEVVPTSAYDDDVSASVVVDGGGVVTSTAADVEVDSSTSNKHSLHIQHKSQNTNILPKTVNCFECFKSRLDKY